LFISSPQLGQILAVDSSSRVINQFGFILLFDSINNNKKNDHKNVCFRSYNDQNQKTLFLFTINEILKHIIEKVNLRSFVKSTQSLKMMRLSFIIYLIEYQVKIQYTKRSLNLERLG
jgi:hypothetical protein